MWVAETYRGFLDAEEDSGGLDDVQSAGVAPRDLSGLHADNRRRRRTVFSTARASFRKHSYKFISK